MEEDSTQASYSTDATVIRGRPSGWVKLYRCLLDHPRFTNGDWLKLWLWLLLKATHQQWDVIFGGKRITLQLGQLITSRQKLSENTGIEVSKVERLLKVLQTEQQIEQRSSNASRLITITNWSFYQRSEQPIEHRMNNDRTAAEQQVNSNKNGDHTNNDEDVSKKPRTQPSGGARKERFSAEVVQGIYDAYPKKPARGPTSSEVRAIRKALVTIARSESDPAAWMLDRVEQYATYARKQLPRFVKTLLNYFRDESYNDVYRS